jgi:hypothetical protein
MKKLLLFSGAFLLLAASTVRADGEGGAALPLVGDGSLSIGLPSSFGLTGMRDMIDARIPAGINVRGLLRFDDETQNLSSSSQSYSQDLYQGNLIVGASALKLFDVGVRVPLEWQVEKDRLRGDPTDRTSADGIGNTLVSGKVGFQLLPWLTIGPYVTAATDSGSSLLDKSNMLTVGGCGTFAIWEERLAAHVNMSTIFQDGGKWSFKYRVGGSVVPFASDPLLFRVFAYFDGQDYVGDRVQGSEASIYGGVQALFFKFVMAEVSFGWRVYAGDLPHAVKDESTYGLDVGAGVSFTF